MCAHLQSFLGYFWKILVFEQMNVPNMPKSYRAAQRLKEQQKVNDAGKKF